MSTTTTLNPTAQEFRPKPPTYPYPQNIPTRTLVLTLIPPNISETQVRENLEMFGHVRAVQMEHKHNGIITVHFYDIRHAIIALNEIQQQHMQQQCRLRKHFESVFLVFPNSLVLLPPPVAPPARGLLAGKAVWAQFVFPVGGGIPDGYNQGMLLVFSDVAIADVRKTFQAFGCLKEIRDSPIRKNQKIVEFFDIRDAAKAVAEMNGKEINGKPVVVEFIRVSGVPYRPHSPPENRLVDYNGGRECNNVNLARGESKKNGKKFFKQPEQQVRPVSNGGSNGNGNGGRNKQWRGSRYAREKCDFRFLIKEDTIIPNFKDPRTTVMIKNIPNKYSQKLLLNMLDNHCIHYNEQLEADGDDQPLSAYDFVYLPIDFVNKCNVGYGFVNMTSPEATWRLYKAFHHQNWEVFNSKKICEVSYARLQGLEALKDHFKNSKFPGEAEEYMPVVFTPPRDGQTTTDPMPITGRNPITTATSSSSSTLSSEIGFLDLTDSGRSSKSDATITTDGGDGDGMEMLYVIE